MFLAPSPCLVVKKMIMLNANGALCQSDASNSFAEGALICR